jgi:hypothetical protein
MHKQRHRATKGSPIINTPFRPRPIVWRLKSKAAAAERALHTAALLKPKYTAAKTHITLLSQANSGASTPSKVQIGTVNSTPYTTMTIASSEDNDRVGSQDADDSNSLIQDVVEEDDQDEDFEDIEETIQQITRTQQLHLESAEAIKEAQELWLDVETVALQYSVL